MSPPRSHLVDRAVEAMGGLDVIAAPPRPVVAPGGGFEGPLIRAAPAAAPVPTPDAAAAAGEPAIGVTLAVLQRAGLVLEGGIGRNRVLEEVRVVGHGVHRTIAAGAPGNVRGRVVLVTSARPGEGKTFMALNVAANLAAGGGQPVVLVDTDGKQGSLSALLGLTDRPGLRSLVTEPARAVLPPLIRTEVPRLSVLPYGAPVAGAHALPSGATLAAVIRAAVQALPNSIIVLDSSPCLVTSDPGALANVAGQVLLVVESERTQRSEVEAALDLVEACPVLQLVLNNARFTDSDTFGTYSAAYGGDGQ